MSKPITAYQTTKTGAQKPQDITATETSGDKYALDTFVRNSAASPVPVTVIAGGGATFTTKRFYNETIASANVEQSLVLPAQITGYMIRSRGNGTIKLSHTSGQSGVVYLTVPRSATHTDEHSYQNLTLYFQSNVASDVIEVIAWEA